MHRQRLDARVASAARFGTVMTPADADDPYSRFSYRRLIAWPERIARERPFLERQIARSPGSSLLDLGCGTGEHALLFASLGIETTGVDRSDKMIERAREYQDRHPPHGPRFVLGDFAELPTLVADSFGTAICLGNVLPHLDDATLDRCLEAWHRRLVPEGRLIVQLLNYERILGEGIRHLPLNFRDDPKGEGEIVFLRLMTPIDDHHIRFQPTTLRLRPGHDPALELKATKEVRLRAWRRPELESRLAARGFRCAAAHGDMSGGLYLPRESADLVLVAVRES